MLLHLKNHHQLSKSIILTLALTGLLTTTINITSNDTALSLTKIEETKIAQRNTDILPRRIANKIIRDASVRSNEKIKDLIIDKVTPNTFSNLCIFKFGEFCTREYAPIQGWVVIVKVKGQSWTYHVNNSGSRIVVDPKISFFNVSRLPINIANRVMQDAAKRAGVKKSDLRVESSTQKVFSNSCDFKFGKTCNKMYKPIQGWEIVLKVKDESWTYHINKSGSQIVIDPNIKAVQGKEVPQKIRQKILRDAYQRIRLETSGITVVRTVEKTFSNSCVFNFGEICTQQYDPVFGWEVVIKVNREYWTYHVDREGSRMVLDPQVVESLKK